MFISSFVRIIVFLCPLINSLKIYFRYQEFVSVGMFISSFVRIIVLCCPFARIICALIFQNNPLSTGIYNVFYISIFQFAQKVLPEYQLRNESEVLSPYIVY